MPNLYWVEKGGSRGYVVKKTIVWSVGKKHSGMNFIVQRGFEFESSVPRALHWLFSPDDPYFLKAAAIHDCMLEEGYRRAFADSQWFEAALSEGAPPLRARLAYAGMRARRFALWAQGKTKPRA